MWKRAYYDSLKVLAFILIFYLFLFVISNPSVKVSKFSRFFNSQMLSQYHVLRYNSELDILHLWVFLTLTLGSEGN